MRDLKRQRSQCDSPCGDVRSQLSKCEAHMKAAAAQRIKNRLEEARRKLRERMERRRARWQERVEKSKEAMRRALDAQAEAKRRAEAERRMREEEERKRKEEERKKKKKKDEEEKKRKAEEERKKKAKQKLMALMQQIRSKWRQLLVLFRRVMERKVSRSEEDELKRLMRYFERLARKQKSKLKKLESKEADGVALKSDEKDEKNKIESLKMERRMQYQNVVSGLQSLLSRGVVLNKVCTIRWRSLCSLLPSFSPSFRCKFMCWRS